MLPLYCLALQHHKHLKSANTLERLNGKIKRRNDIVRISHTTGSCLGQIRPLCIEMHESRLRDNRYLYMTPLAEQKKASHRLTA